MAKFGKLGRHKTLDKWYVRINGDQKYMPGQGHTEEEAKIWLEQLQAEFSIKHPEPELSNDDKPLKTLFSLFLKETATEGVPKHRRARETFIGDFLKDFADATPRSLKPYKVKSWVANHPTWGDNYQVSCYKHLSRAFNWCHKNIGTTFNPVKLVEGKPLAKVRGEEFVVSKEEVMQLMTKSNKFYRPVMELLWHCGARPDEILSARASEYNAQDHTLVKENHKNKHRGKLRVIPLSERAEEIVCEQILENGDGLLFHSEYGNQIKPDVFNQHVKNCRDKLGWNRPVIGYSFRHSFACRSLLALVPINIVAAWMGDTVATIEKHYAHTVARIKDTRHLLVG